MSHHYPNLALRSLQQSDRARRLDRACQSGSWPYITAASWPMVNSQYVQGHRAWNYQPAYSYQLPVSMNPEELEEFQKLSDQYQQEHTVRASAGISSSLLTQL